MDDFIDIWLRELPALEALIAPDPTYVYKTRDNRRMKISQLTDRHLLNAIQYILRNLSDNLDPGHKLHSSTRAYLALALGLGLSNKRFKQLWLEAKNRGFSVSL